MILPVLVGLACHGPSVETAETGADPVPRPFGFWSESVPLADLTLQLPLLASMGVEVNLGLTPGAVDLEEAATFVWEAHETGVPVALWPELTVEDGRWPNVRNVDLFQPWWDQILAWVENEDLPVQTLIVDMELSLQVMQELEAQVAEGDTVGALAFLVGRMDEEAYARGKEMFRALVEDAQGRGLRVRLSTLPVIADDFQDGDESLQELLDSPVQGIPWDEASIQAYRSILDQYSQGWFLSEGQTFTPWLAYSYGLTARETWGDAGSLDIGIVGYPDWSTPADLEADVQAALAAGLSLGSLDAFALDQALKEEDPASWTGRLLALEPRVPEEDPNLEALRQAVRDFDAALVP